LKRLQAGRTPDVTYICSQGKKRYRKTPKCEVDQCKFLTWETASEHLF